MHQYISSAWRVLFTPILGPLAAVLVAGCSRGDVGAPCNHGKIDPPSSLTVTFPALNCDQLLCVYGDNTDAPENPCTDNDDCNPREPFDRFVCDNGSCALSPTYVLERSMCSKKCSSDADCANGGVGDRVVADPTECGSGFSCAIIQALGTFCCEKLCVCNDDLSPNTQLEMQCMNDEAPGCCEPRPGEDPTTFVPGAACPGD